MNQWRIKKALRLLGHNPGLFAFKTAAKIRSFRRSPKYNVIKNINGVMFEFDFHYDPEIKIMYDEAYEVETLNAIRRFLNEGDTFIDVGANIGYMSAIALGAVGKTGQVHSFEPVPKYAQRLINLAERNPDYHLKVNQVALSDCSGEAIIAVSDVQNIGWNTIVPDLMSEDVVGEKATVPTQRLDNYIKDSEITNVSLIKIDVEGYELPVLKGLSDFLQESSKLPAIICEITYDAYPLMNTTVNELVEYMKRFGYQAYSIANPRIAIDITKLPDPVVNVIFRPSN